MTGAPGGTPPGGDTHYDTLGVAPDANASEVRRRWVALARRHHPDVAGDDPAARRQAEEQMRAINEAWAVLGDPDRRAAYDATLASDRRARFTPGAPDPDFVPFDDADDPDDPAAIHDVPYGDGSPVPRSLQLGPVGIIALAVVALATGLLLEFAPLVALGAVGIVGGVLSFAAAPVYAVIRSARRGID